jgi:hypothetical protein
MHLILGIVALSLSAAVSSAPVTIDFNEEVIPGVVTSFELNGFEFSSSGPFVVLDITDSPSIGTDGNTLQINGPVPVVNISQADGLLFGLTAIDLYLGCNGDCTENNWVLNAFDADDALINQRLVDPEGVVGWQSQTFDNTWIGIARLELSGQYGMYGGTAYADTIQLNVVPIPAAVWLFGSGLGLLGWLRRKKACLS